ncbi:hypothetical protein [Nonomuraea sp. NPDC050310]|uniref:hypothetical protein n=1 Tax=Nonomuraea sp. NPDC050310 TaxID=3154935 RepID=UPI0033F19B9C
MTLTLPQLGALLMLMAETGEADNTLLKERYGAAIDGKVRTTLNEAKLVESEKDGRVFRHVLTDSGWARAGEELRAGIPLRTGGAVIARVMLAWLTTSLRRGDRSLAEIFAPDLLTPAPAPGVAEPPLPEAPAAASEGSTPEDRVRQAYAALAPAPGDWVRLADLRPLLSDLPREAVDTALTAINRSDGALIPEGNQKSLTPADEAAALTLGNQAKHLLAIGV